MNNDMLTGRYTPVTVRLAVKGAKEIISESSIIAFRKSDDTLAAVGHEAEKYICDTSGDISVVCPFRDGVVAEFDLAATMFKYLIQKYYINPRSCRNGLSRFFANAFRRPSVVLCTQFEMTGVEKTASCDMLRQAGAGSVQLAFTPFEQALREHSSAALIIGME